MNLKEVNHQKISFLIDQIEILAGQEQAIEIRRRILFEPDFLKKHITGIGGIIVPVNIFFVTECENHDYLETAIEQWLDGLNKKQK